MQIDDGRIVSNFIVQALQERPLTVYGDGLQTRSFCYVSDMVEALIRLMDTGGEVTGPVNLGNPHEVPVLELADRLIAMTGSSASIVFKPLPPDDPSRRRPDIGRARRLLRWEPRHPLEEGLAATVEYFREVLAEDTPRVGYGAGAGGARGAAVVLGGGDAPTDHPAALRPMAVAGGAGRASR
jgi:UDP-glucuronate decarboxylase